MAGLLSYFIQLHTSLYNVLPDESVVAYKHASMTGLFPLRQPMHPRSFVLVYGFLFELWVLNLKEEEEEEKMQNSANTSMMGRTLAIPVLY